MATTHSLLLACLCLLAAPTAGAADGPAAPVLRLELDAGASVSGPVPGTRQRPADVHSASLRAMLSSHWSARATVSGRYDAGGPDPARPALHQATVQAGVAWHLNPDTQLDVAVQRGMSSDMPPLALALNWRLRY
ncbi:MAG: hypothetical protein HY855_04155 [Burkholderiales bacterium]|nr:hypothetical protein [Burkholderiales bacterium]